MQLVSNSIYSEETIHLLSLGLYAKDSKSFAIGGLPVKIKDNPYTAEEILFLKTLEEYLVHIGGTQLKVYSLLFCYVFDIDNRKPVLEWYLSLTGVGNYNELEKSIKIEEKKDNIERIITLDNQKDKILFLDGATFFLTSQKYTLHVWDKDTYTNYEIKIFSESEDGIITHLLSLSNKRIIVVTRKGEIVILDMDEKSYQVVKIIPLLSFVKNIKVNNGKIIAGLEDNTIQLYDHEGKLLSTLNKENIYQSYNIFSMGIFHLKVTESNELIAISYNIYDNSYHLLIYNLDNLVLKRKLSLGDSHITGLICTTNRIFVSSHNGEIKVISRHSDELAKMDIEDVKTIYKTVKIVDTNNMVVLSNNGLDAIAYPDKHYHIINSEEYKITSVLSLFNRLVVGDENGTVRVYDGKLSISKVLIRLLDSKIVNIFKMDSRLAITTNIGTLIIIK